MERLSDRKKDVTDIQSVSKGLEISEKMTRSNYIVFLMQFSAKVFLETYCMSDDIIYTCR